MNLFYGELNPQEKSREAVPTYFLNLLKYLFDNIIYSFALYKLLIKFEENWETTINYLREIFLNRKSIFNNFIKYPSTDLNHPLYKAKNGLNAENCIELLNYNLTVWKENIKNSEQKQKEKDKILLSELIKSKIMSH